MSVQANSKLARTRREHKLTREKLCAMAQDNGHSVSFSALVQYERGERTPKLQLAIWLARHFDMTVEELFNGKDKRKKQRRKDGASCV
mgnify:CR=1 FL=1